MSYEQMAGLAEVIGMLPDEDQVHLFPELESWLSQMRRRQEGGDTLMDDFRERRFSGGPACPRCGSVDVHRWGRRNRRQRYRCKDCLRTFNDLTGTPFAHSRKSWEKWLDYAELMLSGTSIRASAEEVGISTGTAFRWRHAMLRGLQSQTLPTLNGIVEVDETFFRHSRKGETPLRRRPRKRGGPARRRGISREQVCVLTARDREGGTFARAVTCGQLNHGIAEDWLNELLSVEPPTLCTDGTDAYRRYVDRHDLEHHVIKSTDRRGGFYHINNINALHSRMKEWMIRFHGVATKYLSNYMAWFVFVDSAEDLRHSSAWKRLVVEVGTSELGSGFALAPPQPDVDATAPA